MAGSEEPNDYGRESDPQERDEVWDREHGRFHNRVRKLLRYLAQKGAKEAVLGGIGGRFFRAGLRLGLRKAVVTAGSGLQTIDRINEATVFESFGRGVESLSILLRGLEEELGFFQSFGFGGHAFFSGSFEEFKVAFHAATDALFVHGETVESSGLFGEGLGHVDGVGDLRVVAGEGVVRVVGNVNGEEILFHGSSADETPMGFGDTAGEKGFVTTDRGEAFDDGLHEGFGGKAFGFGKETDLSGETVAAGVEAGTLLAFLSLRTCGLLGVAAVGFQALG